MCIGCVAQEPRFMAGAAVVSARLAMPTTENPERVSEARYLFARVDGEALRHDGHEWLLVATTQMYPVSLLKDIRVVVVYGDEEAA